MITFETAVRLKELGFPQNTLLHYEDTDNGWAITIQDLNFPAVGLVAAPVVEELIKHVNVQISTSYHYLGVNNQEVVIVHYFNNGLQKTETNNLVETLAKIWIKQHEHTTTK